MPRSALQACRPRLRALARRMRKVGCTGTGITANTILHSFAREIELHRIRLDARGFAPSEVQVELVDWDCVPSGIALAAEDLVEG